MQFLSFEIFDSSGGGSIPGGRCTVYLTGTSTLAALFNAAGGSISNPVIAGTDAIIGFAAADAKYDLQLANADGSLNGPLIPKVQLYDLSTVGTGGSSTVATRSALAALTATNLMARYLVEAGREGWFIFSTANLSTLVTADSQQGVYVAPTSGSTGASGAWVRKYSGSVNVKWFGATGDGTTNDGAAFVAAIALLKAIAVDSAWVIKGSPRLLIPAGKYNMGTTTLDITHTIIIEGEGGLNGWTSRLKWTGDCEGIRTQEYNTSGTTTVDGVQHYSGRNTILRNIALCGPYEDNPDFTGNTEGEFHAIRVKSNITIEDVFIDGWAGDGVHALTSSGAGSPEEGNSNVSFINRLRVTNVRNGLSIDGADANAWTTIGVYGTYCRKHTIYDSSFLGNNHIGAHSANAGLIKGVPPCVVSQGGRRYGVILGQATWCSTNAPTGTASDNQGWLDMGVGAADLSLNIPAWASGTTYREGGGYRTDSANAANLFLNCYQEGGECPSQFVNPTLIIGGLTGGNRDILTTGNVLLGGKIIAPSPSGGNKFGATNIFSASNSLPQLVVHNNGANAAGAFARTDYCQGYEADGVTPMAVARIQVWPSTGSPTTAEGVMYFGFRTFGGGGAFTDLIELNGSTGSTPHLAPLTDNAVDSGRTATRWKNVFAYTGDFKGALTSSSASLGVGYATGAGGTVTQATSKATGVTLNKVCGQITMNAAALAAAAKVSFVVTDSAIAATDTVVVSVASGGTANAYRAAVTAVAAGSFTITVENITAGALSEAPVINFSVLKSVAA